MDRQEADLRRQTVGTGVEVIRSGADVVLRMPAAITFPVGSYAIQPQFQSTLREVAQTLRADNQTYVDVLGHTDASGGEAANQALSVSRAQAVANYLKSRGVVAARVGGKRLWRDRADRQQRHRGRPRRRTAASKSGSSR